MNTGENTNTSKLSGPLAGLKVVELSHVMAGPACGLMLADMGADVIKVEKIPSGDDVRRFVPPAINGVSAAYLMMNRNKRGVALDLKKPEAIVILKRLLRDADVVTENYRYGAMERMGLGFEELRKENPRLIYCSISGFGRTGPYAERGGFDLVAQGMSGLMSITGEGPGRPPVKVGAPVTDIVAGLLACIGILAAVENRHRTGQGQMIDTSLFEAGIIQTYWQSAICMATGIAPEPLGSAHPLSAPYQAFPTSDGWITVGAANQTNWLRLVEALERPDLVADERFSGNEGRMRHREELAEELSHTFRSRSSADWLDRLSQLKVPAGPLLDIKQMHKNEQTLSREMVVDVHHDGIGHASTIGFPIKFSDTPGRVKKGAPSYGQHTREILAELGFSAADIAAMERAGAIPARKEAR